MRFDVIIEIDPSAQPFRELPLLGGQIVEGGALDFLEKFPPADAELAHGALVHALHDQHDGLIAFGKREEGQSAQSPENVRLGKSHSGLDGGLIPRLVGPRRQHADAVMVGHFAIASVDLGLVERGLVDAAL